jgi:cytochrome c oxidase assembly protein subunit 15
MKLNSYQITAITTIAATLFLILVGGLVRASGAGLGCPDWPKCYGLWIPPMDVVDLPAQYNSDEFNAFKTWTEYVNRLIGVLIGLLITATFALSVKYRRTKPSVFYASAAAFVLVLFQGWLGGQVVRTGLTEWVITIHMMTAMVIVGLLIYGAFKAFSGQIGLRIDSAHIRQLKITSFLLLLFMTVQMVLGTQVREAVDHVSRALLIEDRSLWLENIGIVDEIHRSFSWFLMITSVWLVWFSRKHQVSDYFLKLSFWIFGLVLSQVFVGVVLAYLSMPPSFQVLHLFGSAVLFSVILLMVFSVRDASIDE